MIKSIDRNRILELGFVETNPWTEFEHESGLTIRCSDYDWVLEHKKHGWAEFGSLHCLDDAYAISDNFIKKYVASEKQKEKEQHRIYATENKEEKYKRALIYIINNAMFKDAWYVEVAEDALEDR